MIVPVPPVALNVKLPLAALHKAFVAEAVKLTAVGCDMVNTVLVLHALASVATIVYVPAPVANGLL